MDRALSKYDILNGMLTSFGLTIHLVLVEAVPVIVTSVGDSIPAPLNEKRPFFIPLKSRFVAHIPDGKYLLFELGR